MLNEIKKASMEARKAKDTVRANLFMTILGEAGTRAKNEQREVNDNDVIKTIEKTMKSLVETNKLRETPKTTLEIEFLKPFMPVDEAANMTLDQIVDKVFTDNPALVDAKQDKPLMGQVMKMAKGRFKAPDVIAMINERLV